jgi:hypothetical protein
MSITHSECNIFNGPIFATAISCENRNQCWREMAASPTERSWCVLEFAVAVQHTLTANWTSWSSWDVDPKVLWTILLQRMHLSSMKGSRGEAKCYRRDGRQGAWNFYSQPQESCAESQSRVLDTANIPLSNGSDIMYFCSVFVKIWFFKMPRLFICTLYILIAMFLHSYCHECFVLGILFHYVVLCTVCV